MIFNSFLFLLFMVVFLALFYVLPMRRRMLLLFLASCLFYGFWDKYFLLLLFLSISVDYIAAIQIEEANSPAKRKKFLFLSMGVNLSILFIFKYFVFMQDAVLALLAFFHLPASALISQIIYPVGISFYTFQAMSYVIDVYRGRIQAERNFLHFATFVTFFPQLVAGPIERMETLMPQLKKLQGAKVRQVQQAIFLLLWGLILKVLVADNISRVSDYYFAIKSSAQLKGAEALLGIVSFALQIYGDFGGYSYMAMGLGKLIGVELTQNFNRPFLALSFHDFWHRWNITVSEWFKDYVYFPLGGSRQGKKAQAKNLLLTMAISGLWHGAHGMKILWGIYHGVLLVLTRLFSWPKKWQLPRLINIFFYLLFSLGGYLLFRAQNLKQAGVFVRALFSEWSLPQDGLFVIHAFWATFFLGLILVVEIIQEKGQDLYLLKFNRLIDFILALILALMILVFGGKSESFIYFQF